MDNKNKVTNDFKKKVKEIKKHNDYYFKDDNPKISDADYDKLKKEVIELEKKHAFKKIKAS